MVIWCGCGYGGYKWNVFSLGSKIRRFLIPFDSQDFSTIGGGRGVDDLPEDDISVELEAGGLPLSLIETTVPAENRVGF